MSFDGHSFEVCDENERKTGPLESLVMETVSQILVAMFSTSKDRQAHANDHLVVRQTLDYESV